MIFSPQEIEQLNNLLLSPEKSNKSIALGLIKNSPEQVKTFKTALCVTAYLSDNVQEDIEGLAHDLLVQNLSEVEINQLQNQIIILDYAQYKFKVKGGWSTFQNPLRNFLHLHENAIEDYLPLFKLNPEPYAQIYTLLASRIQKEWKNHQKALFFYEKAMELNPHNTQAHFGFAMIIHVYYIKKGERLNDVERVLEYYMNAYKSPKNINAYRNAAMLCKDIKDFERSAYYYQEGLNRCPDDTLLLNNFANLLMSEFHDFGQAKKLVTQALDLSPNDPSLWDTLAHIEMNGFKNFDRAKILFERVLEKDGEHHYSYTGLGDLYTYLEDYPLAEKYYLKGLHNGLQYTSREVFEIIEKLEKLVLFYKNHAKNNFKLDYYQQKLSRLKNHHANKF